MQAGERATDGGRGDEGSRAAAFAGHAGQRPVAPRNGGGGDVDGGGGDVDGGGGGTGG